MFGSDVSFKTEYQYQPKQLYRERLTKISFAYGWCGEFLHFVYGDYKDQAPLNFGSQMKEHKEEHYYHLKEGEYITNIKLRFVHTTSYEFGSNIVGFVFNLNSGKKLLWDALQYPNHYQKCYEIKLNGGKIVGMKGNWTRTTHPQMSNIQFAISYTDIKPTFGEITTQHYK